MTTWDIVDRLEPNVQITVIRKNQFPLVGALSSAVRTAVILTVTVAASGANFVRSVHPSTAVGTASQQIRKANQSVSTRPRSGNTDTQVGQSSSRLARSFSAFFQPAPDEPENDEDDYSFA